MVGPRLSRSYFELGGWGLAGLAALAVGAAAVVDQLFFSPEATAPGDRAPRLAQEPRVESIGGTVRDEDGRPLGGVHLIVPAHGAEAISNRDGSYRIELRARRDEEVGLRASCADGACQSFTGSAMVGDQGRNLTLRSR